MNGEDSVRATAHLGPGVLGKAQPTMVLARRERTLSDACFAYIDSQVTGPFRLYKHKEKKATVRPGMRLKVWALFRSW